MSDIPVRFCHTTLLVSGADSAVALHIVRWRADFGHLLRTTIRDKMATGDTPSSRPNAPTVAKTPCLIANRPVDIDRLEEQDAPIPRGVKSLRQLAADA